jgi:hypothetical protein
MKIRTAVCRLVLAFFPALAIPQSQPAPAPPTSILVKAARLLDAAKGGYLENGAVWIEGERIREVGPLTDVQLHAPNNIQVIDLRPRYGFARADRLPHPPDGALRGHAGRIPAGAGD